MYPHVTRTHGAQTHTCHGGCATIGNGAAMAAAGHKLYSSIYSRIIEVIFNIQKTFSMPPHDVVDLSLIINKPRKRKLASYATDKDNRSADKNKTIKRLKKTMGLMESQTSELDDDNDSESTHSRHDPKSSNTKKGSARRRVEADSDHNSDADPENPDTEPEDAATKIEEIGEAAEEDPEQQLGKQV